MQSIFFDLGLIRYTEHQSNLDTRKIKIKRKLHATASLFFLKWNYSTLATLILKINPAIP